MGFFSVLKAIEPVKVSKWGTAEVNYLTMETTVPGVFCGGDFAGIAQTTVESVNDGKTAAWFMHKYLQVSANSACPTGKYYLICVHTINKKWTKKSVKKLP